MIWEPRLVISTQEAPQHDERSHLDVLNTEMDGGFLFDASKMLQSFFDEFVSGLDCDAPDPAVSSSSNNESRVRNTIESSKTSKTGEVYDSLKQATAHSLKSFWLLSRLALSRRHDPHHEDKPDVCTGHGRVFHANQWMSEINTYKSHHAIVTAFPKKYPYRLLTMHACFCVRSVGFLNKTMTMIPVRRM